MSDFHQNSNMEKLGCDVCHVEFSTKYHLERHLVSKNCQKNLTHECKNCKAGFVSLEKLKIHTWKNCPKKHFCHICFIFFKSKTVYEKHLLSHQANHEGNET